MKSLWTKAELDHLFHTDVTIKKQIKGLSIDTRTLQEGDLFVALKGPVADGHDYIEKAFQSGATAAIVERQPKGVDVSKMCLQVRDSFAALRQLAVYSRSRTRACIAGVTGSYGKTSCKDALYQLLSRQGKTHATKSSFNNHWGVPLSLAGMRSETEFAIFEMGMNNPGEIKPLSLMVRPNVALITTIAAAHIGNMHSIRAIAEEKADIFEGMCSGSIAILNEESAESDLLKKRALDKDLKILTFGTGSRSFASLKSYYFNETGLIVNAEINGQALTYSLPVRQKHWAFSSLGVLATLSAMGADVAQAASDFQAYELPEGRGRRIEVPFKAGSITILDESYNAGPGSMQQAIESLQAVRPQGAGRCIAILADMLELGHHSKTEHQALAPLLEQAKVDLVFTLGTEIKALHDVLNAGTLAGHADSNDDIEALIEKILTRVQPGDVYLLKGSRGQRAYRGRLARVVDALKKIEILLPDLRAGGT